MSTSARLPLLQVHLDWLAIGVTLSAGQGAQMATPQQRIGTDVGEKTVLADVAAYGWHCMNIIEDDGQPP